MFRRLLASLCLLLTLAATAHDKNADHNTKAAYRAERPNPKTAGAPLSAAPAGDYYRPCNQARQQSESDLCAQWHAADAAGQSAYWAQRQFWLSVIGFAGLLATLILNWFSTRAATGTLQ